MIDFNKYRKLSPYYSPDGKTLTHRDLTLNQAKMEFDYYQKYMPNTHQVYINNNIEPILATMTDVTDLEARSDSKWMYTSLENKVYKGDIVRWDNHTCLCIYNRIKNVVDCNKVKIQPCNTHTNLAVIGDKNTPIIKSYPVIVGVYITDIQEGAKRIPVDSDLLGVSITYDEYTNQIEKQARIYLYDNAYEIVGIDYTNINFENGTNKGYLRWMIKASSLSKDTDNLDLKVCDYYKIFPKNETVAPIIPSNIQFTLSKSYLKAYDDLQITITSNTDKNPTVFEFEGNNLGCYLNQIDENNCIVKSSGVNGIVKIKINYKDNPTIFSYAKIQVKGEF